MQNDSVKEIREANWSEARFLSEEEQARYLDSIKQFKGKAHDSLNVPKNGSNLFKVLYLNQIGIRTATLLELEDAFENGLPLRGKYEDAKSAILRSKGDSYTSNNYLAKLLSKEIKTTSFKNPVILNGLKVVADNNSEYGLSLKPGEKFEIMQAPDFSHKNNERRFSRINPDYTIEFDDKGTKKLYTRDNGLFGLYLNWDLNLDSKNEYLAGWNDNGRVVIVSAEDDAKI